ncbi:hypothetical protein JKF63_02981 [Porcisia hertigi]|uniref:C2H2-type domain-containing protein n=1 Tax=Porcisia hertigi TaxID=2761500 RepID=A0A836L555_9TRYP|nr:hypothetical protein JKF63_02981 [Porcisia hertigi]
MAADSLRLSCKQILQRLQQKDVVEFSCVLCGQLVRGQDALMDHLITEHEVHCLHFDNVADLDGLLQHLSVLLHGGAAASTQWICPVCGEDTGSDDVRALLDHLRLTGHKYWNPRTIPSLASWYITCTSVPGPTADKTLVETASSACSCSAPREVEQDSAEDGDIESQWNDMEDEDEDWSLKCDCLYCDYTGEDILQHLKSNHHFDLRLSVQQRADLKDEYDLIRVVNMVRRAMRGHRCPYGDECGFEGKESDYTVLEAHLLARPEHRLPKQLSRGHIDLIPFLSDDGLISMLLASGAGFLQVEEEDPDFPMVPTVRELALAASRAPHK